MRTRSLLHSSAQVFARFGLVCWVAAIFLAWSPAQRSMLPTVLAEIGAALMILSFLCWHRVVSRAGIVLPLRRQIVTFGRPLVGLALLIAGVTLSGAVLAADTFSLLYLSLAVAIAAAGAGLARGTVTLRPQG